MAKKDSLSFGKSETEFSDDLDNEFMENEVCAIDKEAIFEILSAEGFRPKFDEDNDIFFKFEGMTLSIIFDEDDKEYFRISLFMDAEDYDLTQLRNMALEICSTYKIGKCSVRENKKETFLDFSIELLTTTELFKKHLNRYLGMLRGMRMDFFMGMEKEDIQTTRQQ